MQLLDARELDEHISEDLENCNTYSFAIAWVTGNNYYELLKENIEKIDTGIIGLNSYHTSPEVLREFSAVSDIYFRQDKKGIFHPKVHIFNIDENAHIYIGSSNLTHGGLFKNAELNIKIITLVNSDIYNQTMHQINSYINNALSSENINNEYIENYRKKYDATRDFKIKLNNSPIEDIKEALNDIEEYSILDLNWDEYIESVENEVSDFNDEVYQQRLSLLDKSQSLFKEYGSLKSMPIEDQRIIAGIELSRDKKHFKHRGWFGKLKAKWALKGHYNDEGDLFDEDVLEKISDAVDLIPFEGKVTFEDFEDYVENLLSVSSSDFKTSKASAFYSRFLVLKRPDIFITLNGGNQKLIEYYYPDIKNPKNYFNYWKLVQKLKKAEWYKTGDKSHPVWRYRMAFIDSLTYSYTNADDV